MSHVSLLHPRGVWLGLGVASGVSGWGGLGALLSPHHHQHLLELWLHGGESSPSRPPTLCRATAGGGGCSTGGEKGLSPGVLYGGCRVLGGALGSSCSTGGWVAGLWGALWGWAVGGGMQPPPLPRSSAVPAQGHAAPRPSAVVRALGRLITVTAAWRMSRLPPCRRQCQNPNEE